MFCHKKSLFPVGGKWVESGIGEHEALLGNQAKQPLAALATGPCADVYRSVI